MWRRSVTTFVGAFILLSCASGGDERIAELERQIEALSTPETKLAPTPTESSLPPTAPSTTEAPSPTVTPTTTEISSPDQVLAKDKDLIRSLVYEQQQFVSRNLDGLGDWTVDHYFEYDQYMLDRTEPTVRNRILTACQNNADLIRAWWAEVPTAREAEVFERWVVDLTTVAPDPDWRPEYYGRKMGPFEGRTYIATVTFEALDKSRTTADVHFNVQGSEAFWFQAGWSSGCEPGS